MLDCKLDALIRSFAWEKKGFSCQHKSARITWPLTLILTLSTPWMHADLESSCASLVAIRPFACENWWWVQIHTNSVHCVHCGQTQGRNFVPKSGGYQFSEATRGAGVGSLFTLEKAHFGTYLGQMHSDVLVLKLCFAEHRMLQGCATDSVSFSLTGCSSWGGLAPLTPDSPKLRPSLPTRFPPPFLVHSFSFLAKWTRCSYAAACSL